MVIMVMTIKKGEKSGNNGDNNEKEDLILLTKRGGKGRG